MGERHFGGILYDLLTARAHHHPLPCAVSSSQAMAFLHLVHRTPRVDYHGLPNPV